MQGLSEDEDVLSYWYIFCGAIMQYIIKLRSSHSTMCISKSPSVGPWGEGRMMYIASLDLAWTHSSEDTPMVYTLFF